MVNDIRGLPVSTASNEAAGAFDHAIVGYLSYRSDLPARVEAMLASDPNFAMAHIFKGYLAMLAYKKAALPMAAAALAAAAPLLTGATAREQAHGKALGCWINGHPDMAASIWREILLGHPLDVLAFRLHHFVNFWFGRPDVMLEAVSSVEKHWSGTIPGYNAILGCRCFAHEESGNYTEAEAAGREAIHRDPSDLWSAHGVAHVLEMTGRRDEGIAWIEALQSNWTEGNNLKHHLWWHQAMFHLERGDFSRVLDLYDHRFRDLASPLVVAAPDVYIDVQNAASMLFRLRRHGIDAGGRWVELADQAEARIGDCQSAFTLPHWMMALAASGRDHAAKAMLAGMRDYAQMPGINARLVADVALPVCEAVLAHGTGQHARAVDLMRPVLGEMYRLGGSHAQQDVLEQLFLDSALKAGLGGDVQTLMERVSTRHPLPPTQRRGYATAG